MIFSCLTLGCKTNQTETDALAAALETKGHTRAAWGEPSRALIINTCSVTSVSDRKSRGAINKARKEQPGAVIAVHGCMAQGMTEKPPDIDVLGGTGDRAAFIEELERAVENLTKHPSASPTGERRRAAGGVAPYKNADRTRAFLKIQDGCSNACAYCIIPSLRGGSRSIPYDEVLSGAEVFARGGAREIVLTGIEISAYDGGVDALAARLAERFPRVRFRLGSLDPSCVTETFAETLSKYDNICPHFHIALQSGCGRTLTAMNRSYGAAQAARAVELLRAIPLLGGVPAGRGGYCTTGCDLIAGFPGETEEDFAETLEFIEKQNFTFMHIFPYSKRPGTVAAGLGGQLTNAVKKERASRAAALADKLFERSADRQDVLSVLFESERGGFSVGHADNYFEVSVKGTGLRNEVRHVKITGRAGKTLTGEILSPTD